MVRQMPKCEDDRPVPAGAEVSHRGERDQDKPAVGRRRLLTGGGVVAAGMVGAGLAAAAAAPASAAAGGAILQDTVNNAGTANPPTTPVTELDADNNTLPAFILTNTGVVPATSTTPAEAGPTLRLTPSTALFPASMAGGDLTSTGDGFLWFTHNFGGTTGVVPAPVYTEATSNIYAQLLGPSRVLDTRSSSGRKNIVNASGNLDSHGRLIAGHTIAVNLDSLVFFAEAVFANITVTGMARGGFLTVWSGAVARPTASTIDFGTQTLANFLSSGVSEFSTSILNVVAIYASATTHVILDVSGFSVPGFEFVKVRAEAASASARASRLQRARQAMRNAQRA